MKLNTKTLLNLTAASTIAFSALSYTTPAFAAVTMYDEFFIVGNNTKPKGDLAESVEAAPEEVVEFFFRIRNTGDEDAKRVQVWATLPSESSKNLTVNAYIRPNNTDRTNIQISDSVTVKVSGDKAVGLRFFPGHTRFAGTTNKFNCPNVCDINNEDVLKGIEVGDVPAGKEVQVGFKAFLTKAEVSPTQAPTQAPTNAPTNQPTSTPVVVSQTKTDVKALPETGLPLAGVALAGLFPLGARLRKYGHAVSERFSANDLWTDRELKK